jgi:hypothetical protein
MPLDAATMQLLVALFHKWREHKHTHNEAKGEGTTGLLNTTNTKHAFKYQLH